MRFSDLLVGDRGGALGEGTLLDDVVDLPEEGVGRGLPLGEAVERLDAAHQLGVRGRQRRATGAAAPPSASA